MKKYILIGSFVISFIILIFIKEPMQPDSYSYDSIGWNLAQGRGYTDVENKTTMEREPMYPFFLAFVYLIFGHSYLSVQIIQIILFLLTVIFVYKIAKLIFDEKIAIYSMVITAFFPTLANYPSYILSEALFTFLLSLFIFGCIKIYFTDKLGYYLLAGGILGISTLCKAIMLPFVFILILWLVFLKFESKCRAKFIIKMLIMVLTFAILVIPWMSRNYLKFGSFSLREGSEVSLCVKVIKLDYGLEDFKKAFIFTISENLGKRMFSNAVKNPRDFLFKEDILVREKILPKLREEGYGSKEIKSIMMAKITKKPFKFLAISSLDLLKMTQFTYIPILIDQEYVIKKIISFPHGNILLSLLRSIFRLLAYVLILFSIIAMWIQRAEWKKWILLVLLIAYTNLIYSLIYGHGRYAVPLIPYYIVLSAPVIAIIKEKMKGMIKCQK